MSDPEHPPTAAETAERERVDREAREKEAAEQAALPYKWSQTLADAEVTIAVPGTIKGRDLKVELRKESIFVGIKGGETFIEGKFPSPIHVDESTWTLESTSSPPGKEIAIHLDKVNRMEWWAHIVTSAPKIDVAKITPENSKLSDLDGATRSMVEKMMYDQRQKEMGKPTSEEERKRELLERFTREHPEMDFSNATIG
ncbi:hypothetical protein FQN55_006727 [Onygenales sp. PD_40]|nr:hypothetical protein FQN55_006727 [Onygenales sp. PD_40]KAK2782860.1 hypothetical protein FQN53_009546 [Emmonsiellopsis sp. PD_33]KAK2795805.1 hypothetical protein FQN52_003655 [Onygenales sp. PD_12]